MRADQEGRPPHDAAIADEGGDGDADHDVPRRRRAPEMAEAFLHDHPAGAEIKRRVVLFGRDAIGAAAGRLDQRVAHDKREDETRQTDHEEGGTPAIPDRDPAADKEADHHAEIDAERIDRHGACALLGRIHVGDHGMRRRARPCLTDADADTRERELPEILCKPANRRHAAPDRNRPGDDIAPVAAVGDECNRNAERRIENGEGNARQKSELRVGQHQIGFHGLHQDAHDVAVHMARRIAKHEDRQRISPVGRRQSARHAFLCRNRIGHSNPPVIKLFFQTLVALAGPGNCRPCLRRRIPLL